MTTHRRATTSMRSLFFLLVVGAATHAVAGDSAAPPPPPPTKKNCLIVLAHPNTNRSLSHALAATAAETLRSAGCAVRTVDLYALNFSDGRGGRDDFAAGPADDADFEYEREQARAAADKQAAGTGFAAPLAAQIALARWADAILFQWPVYWYQPPAVVQAWYDRVLANGVFYEGGIPPAAVAVGPRGRATDDDGGGSGGGGGHSPFSLTPAARRGENNATTMAGKVWMTSVTAGAPRAAYTREAGARPLDELLFGATHLAPRFVGVADDDVAPTFACYGADTPPSSARDAKHRECTAALAAHVDAHLVGRLFAGAGLSAGHGGAGAATSDTAPERPRADGR